MPWEIFEHDGQFCLRNTQTMKMIAGSCHSDRAATRKMQQAMYANVPEASMNKATGTEEALMDDSLTYYGGAVKALGDGRIGGYVAIFTTANDPDLQGDFFSKSTEFYLESGDQRPIIYDHGLDKTLKRRQLARAVVKIDDAGVWMEGKLALRDAYEKKIYEMAEKGALGWSTGSASHLVARSPRGKSFHLDSWPIVEASLTPTPVEPRTSAVPLKSLAAAHIDLDDMEIKHKEETTSEVKRAAISSVLSAIIAPVDLKGWDEGSDTVAAAVKEHVSNGRYLTGAVKSFAGRLRESFRLRTERDHRPISKSKRAWVATARQDIGQQIADLKALDDELADIQKQFDTSDAEQDAITEQVRFELLRTRKITGE